MAKFKAHASLEELKELEELEVSYKKMFGEMCKAGAEVVHEKVVENMGKVFDTTKSLEQGLRITKVYETPSDDGINVHIGFYGYNDKGIPIPLIANAREYGTSQGEVAKPFFRKSFRKAAIKKAMLQVQKKYIKD